jgi:hypothetical protein
MKKILLFVLTTAFLFADDFSDSKKAILQMSGCFLVDYSYVEVKSLKKDYERDVRIYDVSRTKTVKEWIYPIEFGDKRIRLQHVLFMTGADGKVIEDSYLKHPGEDWEYEPTYLYEFVAPSHWSPKKVSDRNVWVRKITHLDDGLRYQCAAPWKVSEKGYPEWSCNTYSPIPGREYRDMKRKDYNTLDRTTRLIVYGNSYLERQDNIKTIHTKEGVRTPLAQEVGKNWYVRLKDEECKEAQDWVKPQKPFWTLLQKTWDEVLTGKEDFKEQLPKGSMPRFLIIGGVQQKYIDKLDDSNQYNQAKKEVLEVIEKFRTK